MAEKDKTGLSSLTEQINQLDSQISELRSGLLSDIKKAPTSINLEPLRLPRSQGSIAGSAILQALNTSAGIPGFQNRVPEALEQNRVAREAFANRQIQAERIALEAKRSNLAQQFGIDLDQLRSAMKLKSELSMMRMEQDAIGGTGLSEAEFFDVANKQSDEIRARAERGDLNPSEAGNPYVQYALGLQIGDVEGTRKAITDNNKFVQEKMQREAESDVRAERNVAARETLARGTTAGRIESVREDLASIEADIKEAEKALRKRSLRPDIPEDEELPANLLNRPLRLDTRINRGKTEEITLSELRAMKQIQEETLRELSGDVTGAADRSVDEILDF